jgi:hypothetical protein
MSFRIHRYRPCDFNNNNNNNIKFISNDNSQLSYNDKYIFITENSVKSVILPRIDSYVYGKSITIGNRKKDGDIRIYPFPNNILIDQNTNYLCLENPFTVKLIADSSNSWYNTTN